MSEVERLKKELAEAEEREKAENALPAEFRIADRLHSKMCHWNHTDGCAWHYYSWNNYTECKTRVEYVNKAKCMLNVAPLDTINKILDLM